jgi:hypothetical protein
MNGIGWAVKQMQFGHAGWVCSQQDLLANDWVLM